MPPAARRASPPVAYEPEDPQVAAIDRQTDAISALAQQLQESRKDFRDELLKIRTDFKPAADALHSLGDAQVKLCNFLVNNRLKLVGGLLAALVAVGAISPNVAAALGGALKTMGVS